MTFFPFVRFDNYNLTNDPLDRVKPGVYFTSSDYLNRYSIFGAFSINKRMERDVYASLEYRNKIPLLYSLGIKPTLLLELFSVSRVANNNIFFGVDSTNLPPTYDFIIPINVTYNLFEFDVALKHKMFADGNDIELRFIYSDYTTRLSSFSLPNAKGLYPATKDVYFIGRSFQFTYWHKMLMPYIDSDINPVGREITFQFNYDLDKFNSDGNYIANESGVIVPQYNNYTFFKTEFDWQEHISLNKYHHTINGRIKAGSIIGPELPSFFNYYVGGLVGMKGYPFYSIEGNKSYWMHLEYRLPIFKNIDNRFGPWYLDKIFMSVYADVGNAWSGKFVGMDKTKKAAGAEIRIKMNSFYLFPTAIFVNVAYGFDKFSTVVREKDITYGKEFLFYAGVLFDFSL